MIQPLPFKPTEKYSTEIYFGWPYHILQVSKVMQEVAVSLLHEIRTDWCNILVVILLLVIINQFCIYSTA